MKQGWELKKLGDICENLDSKRVPITKSSRVAGDIPYYGASGIVDYVGDYLFNEDLLCVSEDGANLLARTYPIAFSISGKTWVNNHAHVLKFNNSITQKLVELYLNSIKLDDYVSGMAQPKLNQTMLNQIPIPIPQLPEQERIVSILDKAFSAIDQAKQNAEKNLKNAKELFDSYLNGIFTNNDNWNKYKWGEICEFVRGPFGGSLKKNIFKTEGFVVYEQKHAIHDHFNELRYFIDEDKFNEMKRFELFSGDLIMSCSGATLGKVAVVPDNIKRGIINQALLKLTPKKTINVHFLKNWLRSVIFNKIITNFSGGAAIPNVPSAKILKEIIIPCPDIIEQNKIVNEINFMISKTNQLKIVYQKKITELDDLKKSILQKAFNGELL